MRGSKHRGGTNGMDKQGKKYITKGRKRKKQITNESE